MRRRRLIGREGSLETNELEGFASMDASGSGILSTKWTIGLCAVAALIEASS
jgi:hypothetical protein